MWERKAVTLRARECPCAPAQAQLPNLESRMVSRRVVFVTSILTTAIACFMLGAMHARRRDAGLRASYDAKLDAIRAEMRSGLGRTARGEEAVPAATVGRVDKSDAGEPLPGT